MALKVRLHRRAVLDLEAIHAFLIQQAHTQAAENVRSYLRTRIVKLGDHPNLGVKTTEPGIKILSPTKYTYRIYFTTTATEVVILHIRHTARRAPKLSELK